MADSYKNIRLLYLTYGENVLESGILKSQVRGMLIEMAKRSEVEYIRLLSFISPRLWIRHRKEYRNLRKELLHKGIDFRVRMMPSAQTWTWLSIPLFVTVCLPTLLSHLSSSGIGIIHSRSYGAGLLATISARLLKIKSVFDPRGMFPEEMVMNNSWRSNGVTYRIWKIIEKMMIKRSDAIIALTPYFKQEFLNNGAVKSIFVPSRLDIKPFMNASENVTTFQNDLLFIGEMDSEWNSPRRVAFNYKRLKENIPGLKLHLITRKDPEYVQSIMNDECIEKCDWTLESSKPEEMPVRIAGSGIGLTMAFRPSGNWPMKYAEYLAAGVPVAVEKEIGPHITEAVKRWKLGIVLDEDDPDSYRVVAEVLQNRAEYGERCMNYAKLKLPISHSAAQYARLYRELLKG